MRRPGPGPAGTALGHLARHDPDENGGAGIVLGGRVVADGDVLRGSGMVADATQLSGWDKAYGLPLEMFGRFCSADRRGVVVLDDAVIGTG